MSTEAPLTGIVVTELGSRIGAGVCGSVAQLGATVVVPEAARPDEGKQAHRQQFMAGKWSMTFDRGNSSDTLLLECLVGRSGVLILERYRSERPVLLGRHSDHSRVVCDVTAFGRGNMGFAESPPTPIALPIVEFMSGIYGAAALPSRIACSAPRRRRTAHRYGTL
jgi:hypothetical protein